MENSIITLTEFDLKSIKLIDLDIDDLIEDPEDILTFSVEHYSNGSTIKLLESKDCRLGDDLYLLLFNGNKTIFSVQQSCINIGKKGIKLFGWDTYVKINFETGKIKTTETR